MCSEGIVERYVNFYTDFAFKKLFGTEINKELLISFLNALLHGREKIEDITYLNAEHLGTQEYDRRAVFDVYCKNEKGEHFIVEMQKGEQQFFKDRSIYYSTFAIREQAPRGGLELRTEGHIHHRHPELFHLSRQYGLLPRSQAGRPRDQRSVLRQADIHLPGNAQVHQGRRQTGDAIRQVAVRHTEPLHTHETTGSPARESVHTAV